MNQLHPFYLVYIKEDGEILSNHLNVKNTLDLLRIMSKGKKEPDKTAYNIFNEFTNDGRNMKVYSELLSQSIESIINIKEENDIDSLFRTGGTTMLKNDIKGLEDFRTNIPFNIYSQVIHTDTKAKLTELRKYIKK